MMWRRIATTAGTVAIFATSWTVGMAVADPPPPRVVLSDVGASALTPIEIDRLIPGSTTSHPIVVSLTSTAPDAKLAIDVNQLEDIERGCNRPERNSGDATCGELEGEMSQQLLVSARLTATDACDDLAGSTPVLSGQSLAGLASAGTLDLTNALVASGEARCLVVTFELPWAADNLVQTDLARFDLVVHAEQAAPDPQVAGAQERPDDGQQVLGATDRRGLLPNAGLAVAGLLALGAGAVTTGGWLVRTTRRRGHA